INSLSLLPLIFSVQLSVAYPYYILEKHYAQSCSKQRLIKQVSCNSKQLNFYKNMLICVGLLYPLITLNFSSFYCVSLFTIAYSCYFFVTSPKKWDLPSGKPRHINISLFSFWITSCPACCEPLFCVVSDCEMALNQW